MRRSVFEVDGCAESIIAQAENHIAGHALASPEKLLRALRVVFEDGGMPV